MVFVEKAIRLLVALIDGVLGWAIGQLYTLIVKIAHVDLFGSYIEEFMTRIYTFLAIFMLFKLSISVVNYILNPDQLTDKSKGYGKLIQNVIIVIGLIIMVPRFFDWAYKLQSLILGTNVLYTVVTGTANESTFNLDEWENMTGEERVNTIEESAGVAGEQIKYELMSSFVYYGGKNGGSAKNDDEYEDIGSGNKKGTCAGVQEEYGYEEAFDCLLDGDTINNRDEKLVGFTGESFTNEYKILISTGCLGFVGYVFLIFVFDVSLRCVRLGVLELIAPIPIISMLDPNSGKNGMFSKWFKDCRTTYLSLFIRLLGVFFAVEMIRSLTSPGRFVWQGTNEPVGFGFVKVFVILGILMFAKQIPQFIENLTGFKMESGGLNLKKKVGGIPGVGAAVGLGGGMAANALASRNNFKNIKGIGGFGKALAKSAGSVIAGGTSGAYRGLTSKEKDGWKAGAAAVKGAVDKRNLRDQRQATGYHLGKRMAAGINTFAGLDPMAEFETKIKQFDEAEKQANAILSRANSEMLKHESIAFNDDAGNNVTMKDFKVAKEYLSALRNRDTSGMTDSELIAHTEEINRLQNSIGKTEKLAEQAYIDAVQSGAVTNDSQTKDMISGLKHTISTTSNETIKKQSVTNGASIKGIKESMANEKVKITNSENYQQALANKKSK